MKQKQKGGCDAFDGVGVEVSTGVGRKIKLETAGL